MTGATMRIQIADGYEISRVIKGGWHLAGGHGRIDREQALRDMGAFVEAGITTFDCADIYTGVEELIGRFRTQYPGLKDRVQVHTKFIPDLQSLADVDAQSVERCIDRSLSRLRMERLDLVQFHWWDYAVPGYVEAAGELARLQAKGKIANIGVTNFDVPRLKEILEGGVRVVSIQAQYSLLDERPRNGMIDLCRDAGIAMICYGTVAGGFLSERWLGQPEPADELTNRSLIKYKLIIDEFGGWELFQQLLMTLQGIAEKHGCDIATVASRTVLDWGQVAAVIVGATNTAHLGANRAIADLRLDAADIAAIRARLDQRRGPNGDVYSLERDRHGRHGRIMKYDLHQKEKHATSLQR
jgi:aryl-alcohol dehydrogenase-like predicted oxidoreductase